MIWIDGIEKDLRNLGVVKWKTKAQELEGWKTFLEQAKTHRWRRRWQQQQQQRQWQLYTYTIQWTTI
jgi:hypothetical protein